MPSLPSPISSGELLGAETERERAQQDPLLDVDGLDAALRRRQRAGMIRVPLLPPTIDALEQLAARRAPAREWAQELACSDWLARQVLRAAHVDDGDDRQVALASAVRVLGTELPRRMAIAHAIGGVVCRSGWLSTQRREEWRRAIIRALACQALAPARGVDEDEAFVFALLHDLGRIIGLLAVEEILGAGDVVFGAGRADDPFVREAIRTVVQRHEFALGMLVAERWGLPQLAVTPTSPQGHAALLELIWRVDSALVVLAGRGRDVFAARLEELRSASGLEISEAFHLQHALRGIGGLVDLYWADGPRAD